MYRRTTHHIAFGNQPPAWVEGYCRGALPYAMTRLAKAGQRDAEEWLATPAAKALVALGRAGWEMLIDRLEAREALAEYRSNRAAQYPF